VVAPWIHLLPRTGTVVWPLAGSAGLAATASLLIRSGALRRRGSAAVTCAGPVRVIKPVCALAEVHRQGEWHYGLLFAVPPGAALQGFRKRSSLHTGSLRKGRIEQWNLRRVRSVSGRPAALLLIPRSWLVLNGFLPLAAAVMRRQRFLLRDEQQLLQVFWLELPEADTAPDEAPQ
jgi:hypothetical protein